MNSAVWTRGRSAARGGRLYDLAGQEGAKAASESARLAKEERIKAREAEKRRKREAQRRQRRIKALEEEIAGLEAEVEQVVSKMSRPDVAANPDKLLELHSQESAMRARIDELMEEWERLAEEEESAAGAALEQDPGRTR